MKEQIHIEQKGGAKYPTPKDNYSPSIKYPEYAYEDLSTEPNDVYDMVRTSLYRMDLDKENYGTKQWSPFKDFIKEGDNVVIKPNFVRHENYVKEFGIDCLITHPSVLRAVIDYVLIALKGTGTITVADAPVQNCDFEQLIKNNNFDRLLNFYKNKNININIIDLRLLQFGEVNNDSRAGFVDVDLGKYSLFEGISNKRLKKLRITNYSPKDMQKYHSQGKHIYAVSNIILNADVIINMPKPKTHKKGGVTISLKNMFGCVAKKECLPHHTMGAGVGDEYKKRSLLKRLKTFLDEKQDKYYMAKNKKSKIINFFLRVVDKAIRIFHKNDTTKEGSWYGNDTLWRTIGDINRIIMYCDKQGKLQDTPQRKMFIVADMIVSGEGEGPLMPSPKSVGIIAVGTNQISFDRTICTLMGFDYSKIPSIHKIQEAKNPRYMLNLSNIYISSNNPDLNGKTDLNFNVNLQFKASENWKNNIQKTTN